MPSRAYRRLAALTTAAVVVMAAACSGDGDSESTSGPTTTAGPFAVSTTAPTSSTVTGGLITAPASTAAPAPGDTTAPADGSTPDAPGATTSIVDDGAAVASSVPSGPTGTLADATDDSTPDADAAAAAGGDPARFCAAVQKAFPLFFVVTVSALTGDEAATEVAISSALAQPLQEMAATAPTVVGPAFQQWAARNAKALDALRATGASAAQIAAFAADFQKQVDATFEGGVSGAPPDPLAAARAAGIDVGALERQGDAFVAANRPFVEFTAALEQATTLSAEDEALLEQNVPCAADLGLFAGAA